MRRLPKDAELEAAHACWVHLQNHLAFTTWKSRPALVRLSGLRRTIPKNERVARRRGRRQVGAQSFPTDSALRAQGFVVGAYFDTNITPESRRGRPASAAERWRIFSKIIDRFVTQGWHKGDAKDAPCFVCGAKLSANSS